MLLAEAVDGIFSSSILGTCVEAASQVDSPTPTQVELLSAPPGEQVQLSGVPVSASAPQGTLASQS